MGTRIFVTLEIPATAMTPNLDYYYYFMYSVFIRAKTAASGHIAWCGSLGFFGLVVGATTTATLHARVATVVCVCS